MKFSFTHAEEYHFGRILCVNGPLKSKSVPIGQTVVLSRDEIHSTHDCYPKKGYPGLKMVSIWRNTFSFFFFGLANACLLEQATLLV